MSKGKFKFQKLVQEEKSSHDFNFEEVEELELGAFESLGYMDIRVDDHGRLVCLEDWDCENCHLFDPNTKKCTFNIILKRRVNGD